MRILLFPALLASILVAACSSTSDTGGNTSPDGSIDSATCTGIPPLICDGCCGTKYAAGQCLDGAWTCVPLGIACAACDAGTTDDAGDAATCPGTPPLICNGCCGSKYAADECVNGAWACHPLGIACVVCDAGATDSAANDASIDHDASIDAAADAATCSGSRPNCFGSNSSLCCGNDPSGQAVCESGAWMCGAAPAPGCNGTSCLLQDAGPG